MEALLEPLTSFLLLFAICLAALQLLGIASRKLNLLLALGTSTLLAITPVLGFIQAFLTQLGIPHAITSLVTLLTLGLLFLIPPGLRMRLRLRTKELDRLYERKAKLEVELERLSKKQEVLKEELRKVDRQILLATKKLEKR